MVKSTAELDAFDVKLLNEIQVDARISSVALAQKVILSPSATIRRHKHLEDTGVIEQYVALLNPDKLGLKVSVFVSIELIGQDEQALLAFEDAIKNHKEVMECYLMTGDKDYLVRIVTSDLESFERYLREKLTRIRGIRAIRSSFALRRVVYKTALPLD